MGIPEGRIGAFEARDIVATGRPCPSGASTRALSRPRTIAEWRKRVGAPAPMPAATDAFLEKHGVRAKIVQSLKQWSVSKRAYIGQLRICPLAELRRANARPNHLALRNGFLVIGDAINGDPIAIELSNGEVAFLSHDILWGIDLECTAFEECVARSTLDIGTFWSRALAEDDFPTDFYSAGGTA